MTAMKRNHTRRAGGGTNVYTVTLPGNAADQFGCPFESIDVAADNAMRAVHGVDPESFAHQVYLLPTEVPGCRW